MELTYYGVRGSYPIARKNQLKYGGNTTCLYITNDAGDELIVDGGSGIRVLGNDMMARGFGAGQGQAHILIGHTHWDHIMGLPFFRPFYVSGNRFDIHSAAQNGEKIQSILQRQQTDLHFPVSLEGFSATLDFSTFMPGDSIALGGFRVETVQLNHPGTTVGFRLEADGVVVSVFTDNGRIRKVRVGDHMGGPEPDADFAAAFIQQLAHCARESDLLIHDTQYFEHEMNWRYDWGHSTIEDALEIALASRARNLSMFHYDPDHSDTMVDEHLALARDLGRDRCEQIIAPHEGLTVEVKTDNLRLRMDQV